MVVSQRRVAFAILSLATIVVSCSNGQENRIQAPSSQAQAEGKNADQTPASQVRSSTVKSDAEVESGKPTDFDLRALATEGALNAASVEAARAAGLSDEKIIVEAARLELSFKAESLSALGLAKFVLKQYGVGDVGGVLAMGLAAVDRARAAGVTDNEIRTYAKLQGIFFGEKALVSLGLSKFVLSNYGVGDSSGFKAMGLASVDRARAAGVTDNEIRIYASLQGISFGEKALVSLGLSKYVLSSYGVGDVAGVKAMGLAAVDRARAAGLSDDEIRKFATLQGVHFGEKALNSLGLSKFVLSNYGTGVVDGVTAMGLAAVDRARAAGLSDAQIKIYAKLQNIFFGEKALVSLG